MNEYTNASNLDHPLTRPVALRRNRVGVSPIVATVTPLAGTSSPVDQLVALHLALLLVDRDQCRLQHPLLVRAARVQHQARADPRRPLALVDVAVERQHGLD